MYPLIRGSVLVGKSGQLHAPAALPPGKQPQYSLVRRSERRGEERILDPTGTRTPTPRPSNPWPLAIPTEMPLLRPY
jgi:hypothetical protein